MKRLWVFAVIAILALCACAPQKAQSDSAVVPIETAQQNVQQQSAADMQGFIVLLRSVSDNYEPGTAGCSLKSAKLAGELMDWYAANRPDAESLQQAAGDFATSLTEEKRVAFTQQIGDVCAAAKAFVNADAKELLDSAGYSPTQYPWAEADITALCGAIDAGLGLTAGADADGTLSYAQKDARIRAMMPALDSIIRTTGVGSYASEYAPRDPMFFWGVLYLMGENWGQTHPLVSTEGGVTFVPRKVMQEFATAAFSDYDDLLPLPDEMKQALTYDESADGYRLEPSDSGAAETVLAGWQEDGDTIRVSVRLLAVDEYLGTQYFTLTPNAYADGITDPMFWYSVSSVSQESYAETDVWKRMDASAPFSVDLDGDGVTETVTVTVDEEAYTTTLLIQSGENSYADTMPSALYQMCCYAGKTVLTSGFTDLYITGDEASDDYMTYVYRLDNGMLRRTQTEGCVVSADGDGNVKVEKNIDVLGSYGALADYRLNDTFFFELISPYTVLHSDGDWDSYHITTKLPSLLVQKTDGRGEYVQLPAGTELIVTSTDAQTYVILEDAAGTQYRAELSHKAQGWGWCVDGKDENDAFVMLPYAG